MTEILTRLEVSSREEAVRVWARRSRWPRSRDRLTRALAALSPLKLGAGAVAVSAAAFGAVVLLPFAAGDGTSNVQAEQLPPCQVGAAEFQTSVGGSVHHDSTYIHVYSAPDIDAHHTSCRIAEPVTVLLTDASGRPLSVLGNGSEIGVYATVRWWDGSYPAGGPVAASAGATGVVLIGGAPPDGTLDLDGSGGFAWTNWCGDREEGTLFFEVRHGDEISVRRSIAPPLCADPDSQSRLTAR